MNSRSQTNNHTFIPSTINKTLSEFLAVPGAERIHYNETYNFH